MEGKNANPYIVNGRWYKFFIESNGSSATLVSSDIEGAELSSNTTLYLPEGYHILEAMYDIHTDATASASLNSTIKVSSANKQGVGLMAAAAYDYQTVYLFCTKE